MLRASRSSHLPALLAAVSLFALGACSRPTGHASASSAAESGAVSGPTIVLIHGLGGSSTDWDSTAQALAPRWRVVRLDLPGHGDAAMPDSFSLDRAEAQLDRALAALGDEPVVLVGHSLGGFLATAEALDHPERVRKLVLVETALRPQMDAAGRAGLLAALDSNYDDVLREAYAGFGRDSIQGRMLYERVRRLDPAHVKPWIRLAVDTDLSHSAAELRMPVLAVLAERSWGKDEAWPEVAQTLGYSGIPRLARERIEGCGHFVMLDRPVTLAAIIDRFATELIAAR